jgi:hypothetical protein
MQEGKRLAGLVIRRALLIVTTVLIVGCSPSSSLVPENTVGGPNVVAFTQTPMVTATVSLTLDLGKKVKARQVAIADVLSYSGDKPKITAPGGWQLIRDDSTATTRQALYWHAIQTNDPSTATWTFTTPVDAQGAIVLIDNADTTSPIDMSSGNTDVSGTLIPKSVVTTYDGDLVLLFYSTDFHAPALAPKMPDNTTTVMDLDTASHEYWILAAYQAGAGPTEDKPCGQGQLFSWAASQVAIKRAPQTPSPN